MKAVQYGILCDNKVKPRYNDTMQTRQNLLNLDFKNLYTSAVPLLEAKPTDYHV
jgi:hypothetical protein